LLAERSGVAFDQCGALEILALTPLLMRTGIGFARRYQRKNPAEVRPGL
jgi:hypothetical protein